MTTVTINRSIAMAMGQEQRQWQWGDDRLIMFVSQRKT
jgi:hypothetical protein